MRSEIDMIEAFTSELARSGLDLAAPFAAADATTALGDFPLERFGRPRALGFVVGNTRALWPLLLAGLPREAHPVDAYCGQALSEAAARTGISFRIYPSQVTKPQAIPIQRLAEVAGLAALSPSYLSVHREHGPWIALRAVVMFDAEGPAELQARPDTCDGCSQPCLPALERALHAAPSPHRTSVADHSALWIAVRDACPVGKVSRYGERQLRYHYLKDRALLEP